MRPRLFRFAAGLSLLLCLAAVALWVRSYWIRDVVGKPTMTGGTQTAHYTLVESNRGRLAVQRVSITYNQQPPWLVWELLKPDQLVWEQHAAVRTSMAPGFWHSIGFQYLYSDTPNPIQNQVVRLLIVPHWLLVLASAILPARWFAIALRAWRAFKPHQCRACGYDVTGNTSGVCPECGSRVAQSRCAPVSQRT